MTPLGTHLHAPPEGGVLLPCVATRSWWGVCVPCVVALDLPSSLSRAFPFEGTRAVSPPNETAGSYLDNDHNQMQLVTLLAAASSCWLVVDAQWTSPTKSVIAGTKTHFARQMPEKIRVQGAHVMPDPTHTNLRFWFTPDSFAQVSYGTSQTDSNESVRETQTSLLHQFIQKTSMIRAKNCRTLTRTRFARNWDFLTLPTLAFLSVSPGQYCRRHSSDHVEKCGTAWCGGERAGLFSPLAFDLIYLNVTWGVCQSIDCIDHDDRYFFLQNKHLRVVFVHIFFQTLNAAPTQVERLRQPVTSKQPRYKKNVRSSRIQSVHVHVLVCSYVWHCVSIHFYNPDDCSFKSRPMHIIFPSLLYFELFLCRFLSRALSCSHALSVSPLQVINGHGAVHFQRASTDGSSGQFLEIYHNDTATTTGFASNPFTTTAGDTQHAHIHIHISIHCR